MAKPRFIETDFMPGDHVKWGPHHAHVQVINISTGGITYSVSYWYEDSQEMGSAFAWELEMIEPLDKS